MGRLFRTPRLATPPRPISAQAGAHFLSPVDDDDVIEGQARRALEVLSESGPARPEFLVILPVGAEELSSACGAISIARPPEPRFRFGRTSAVARCGRLARGEPVTLPEVDSFVDGAAVARIDGQRPLPSCR